MKNLISKITNIDYFERFKTIEDKSIDLIVTSPPYNLDIKYDVYNDKLSLNEYLKTIEKLSIPKGKKAMYFILCILKISFA